MHSWPDCVSALVRHVSSRIPNVIECAYLIYKSRMQSISCIQRIAYHYPLLRPLLNFVALGWPQNHALTMYACSHSASAERYPSGDSWSQRLRSFDLFATHLCTVCLLCTLSSCVKDETCCRTCQTSFAYIAYVKGCVLINVEVIGI